MKTLYESTASATGGRNGQVKSEDGVIDLEVRLPQSVGGEKGDFTNPEQLFACGYASCFDSALNIVASMQKLKIDSKTNVSVALNKTENHTYAISAKINVKIDGVDKDVAQKLLESAHEICPFSNATRGNINVELSLV
ncbi:organic hydroperoxide resistance protein [Marinigracilibium pacificum]|uniref:Organic hydroperoxide resistance protein n=1 Tax=Marinigracilibium pacificum TaxID=2729599 RepID=A0A848J3N8_9BACT|nr:organic hydroperoxide resistance protein [Marinigracilibium pacificum]NMM50125.1 organic hydroperoxide resistance protein [Marinigracilibium pacificum]